MYLQRNENTITLSLFWALHLSHLLLGLLVIKLVKTYLITELSASIYIQEDDFVTLCVCSGEGKEERKRWVIVRAVLTAF